MEIRFCVCWVGLLLWSLSARAQTLPSDWNTLQTDLYTIQYPPDWKANTTGVGGTSFALFEPGRTAVFQANINLVIKDVSEDTISLDELTNINLEMLKVGFTNYSLSSSKHLRDSAGEYRQVIYEYQYGGYFMTQLQDYRLYNRKAYILTFTSLRSRFETYLDVVDEVFKSFRFR